MYVRIRDELLDPKSGISSGYAARLRTKLNLPAPEAPVAPTVPKKP
jgi:hypothetical protein